MPNFAQPTLRFGSSWKATWRSVHSAFQDGVRHQGELLFSSPPKKKGNGKVIRQCYNNMTTQKLAGWYQMNGRERCRWHFLSTCNTFMLQCMLTCYEKVVSVTCAYLYLSPSFNVTNQSQKQRCGTTQEQHLLRVIFHKIDSHQKTKSVPKKFWFYLSRERDKQKKKVFLLKSSNEMSSIWTLKSKQWL